MSFHSNHMNYPIGKGMIRAGMSYIKIEDLLRIGDDRLRKPDPQHYGNTKWGDHVILYFFIKNNFDVNDAAKDLGTSWTNFKKRLLRINAEDWLNMILAFKTYSPKQLTKKQLAKKKKPIKRKGKRVSTLEVEAALKMTNGNVKDAAELLDCSISTIRNKMLGIKD